MKTITILFIALFMLYACEDPFIESDPDFPTAPYGIPDHVETTIDGEKKAITYTYYCYEAMYRSVTFLQFHECEAWWRHDYTEACLILNQ